MVHGRDTDSVGGISGQTSDYKPHSTTSDIGGLVATATKLGVTRQFHDDNHWRGSLGRQLHLHYS